MMIFVVCRLMSGFVDSIRSGEWQPKGSPAIFKIINALDRSNAALKLIFTVKDTAKFNDNNLVKLSGLQTPITLLPAIRMPAKLERWRIRFNEIRQAWCIFRLVKQQKPNLVYIDRSNILAAALIARYSSTPVIIRVLGVTPSMLTLLHGCRLSKMMYRWAWRSPFSFVLCSMDGSPAKKWLSQILAKNIPYKVMLNGVDKLQCDTTESSSNARLKILLLGRLEPIKQPRLFIEAILSLSSQQQNRIEVLIVGSGSEQEQLQKMVQDAGMQDTIIFYGNMPHASIATILNSSDIYVSLNSQGNLSNANLEAMRAGLCLLLLEPDKETGIDLDLYNIVSDEDVFFVSRKDIVGSLRDRLSYIIANPKEIDIKRNKIKAISEQLSTWPQRIETELTLLKEQMRAHDS